MVAKKDEATEVPALALSWVYDAALKEARAKQSELEARAEELADEKVDAAKDRDAAIADLQEARALAAAGERVDISGAERRLKAAQDRLDRADGGIIITSRKLAELRAALPEITARAQRASRESVRRRYVNESRALAETLVNARRYVESLRRTFIAAHTSFSPGSPEAKAYGVACAISGGNGGGPHVSFLGLLREDGQPLTGRIEEWAKDVRQAFGVDVLAGL